MHGTREWVSVTLHNIAIWHHAATDDETRTRTVFTSPTDNNSGAYDWTIGVELTA